MNIQPIQSSNISATGSPGKKSAWEALKVRAKQYLLDALPEATFKDSPDKLKRWDKIDKFVSRPAENRAIMGTTALMTQPWIDSRNSDVNSDTRWMSRNRTIAKIVAGMSVGILVRGGVYKLVERFTDVTKNSKHAKTLIPIDSLLEAIGNSTFLNNHKSALSTGIAILVMCVTNFIIDAPLTVYLTNKMNARTKLQLEKDKITKTNSLEVSNE